MRVDKFIWAIRVLKTRSQASIHCKEGKVSVGQVRVKPSKILKVGDTVVVRKGAVYFSFKVLEFPKSRVGAALVEHYGENVTTKEEMEKFEQIKLAEKSQARVPGRPTKRDRRDWEKAFYE
jgi:ribosome-associated heat shock protein Hsp15